MKLNWKLQQIGNICKGSFTLWIFSNYDCEFFLFIMCQIGADDVVAVAQREHFYWILYRLFVATRTFAVIFRKKSHNVSEP